VARDPRYDVLFEEVRIGPKVMRNRFFQAAHCLSAGSDRPGFQAHFRAMKAEGGWAAVSTEYCSIAPESDDMHRISARIWDEGDVRNLALMCDLVHEHDALAAIELWHGGPTAPRQETRVPAIGPSQAVHMFGMGSSCKAMDRADIARVKQQYVAAATRARSAGFDIITIHVTGGGSLPHQFLLPMWNQRSDEYGGRFENRARFATEITEMIRESVGDECAISVRFGIDTLPAPEGWGDRGIRASDEGHRFIEHLDHLVDLWDINIAASEWGEDAGPSRTHRENFQQPYVIDVKQHTAKPVMNVGRFTSPDTMVDLVASGQLDIIGAARPSIADPFLPRKIEEGRLDDIRECIGCNICISRWEIGGPPLICTQNATSGEEYRRGWHPERFSTAKNSDRAVLIVGAGPAGLECAMVLGNRGMQQVHLVDAEDDPGGHLKWVSRLPGLTEWRRVIDYRLTQLSKLKTVTLITGQRMSAASILEYGADLVIIASGSEWVTDGDNGFTHSPIPGAAGSPDFVLSPEQIMLAGKRPPGPRVVVYDCDGYFVGVGMAELLSQEGYNVTYVTPHEGLAPFTHLTLEAPRLNRKFRRLGINVLTGRTVARITQECTALQDVWDGTAEEQLSSDAVVLVTQRRSDDRLTRALADEPDSLEDAGISDLHAIGDCVAPSLIAETIFSAHRLAREIDSGNPAIPLPFIRERRLIGSTADAGALPPH
jgi:dimethylamine/trimethylamine dehydrogenase